MSGNVTRIIKMGVSTSPLLLHIFIVDICEFDLAEEYRFESLKRGLR
jgi:hypothetical protein